MVYTYTTTNLLECSCAFYKTNILLLYYSLSKFKIKKINGKKNMKIKNKNKINQVSYL